MMRLVAIMIVTFGATLVFAAEEPAAVEGGIDEVLEDLTRLTRVPLPSEEEVPRGQGDDEALAALIDQRVVRVSPAIPTAGFNPVAEVDIALGTPFSPALARRAAERLWESGRYRNVVVYGRPVKDGVELILDVRPMLRVSRLQIEGNKALEDDAIGRAIGVAPDRAILPEPESLRVLREKLQKAYAARGYPEARAVLRLTTTDVPGKVALVIEVTEGEPERYRDIRLPGLPPDVPVETLMRSAGLTHEPLRDREAVERAGRALLASLALAGYYDARLEAPVERRMGRYDLELTLPIVAGPLTVLEFRGNRHLRSRELRAVLVEAGALRTTPERLEQGRQRLLALYQRQGFLFAAIEIGRLCLDERGRPSTAHEVATCGATSPSQIIRFTINEGPSAEVAAIRFTGNNALDQETLEAELFAFVREQLASKELVAPLSTATADDLGLSDKRPAGMGRPRGIAAPWASTMRVYVPEIYDAGLLHLAELYRERGYQSVTLHGRCAVETLQPTTLGALALRPLVLENAAMRTEGLADAVLPPCLLATVERDQLLVQVTVVEGPQTLLSNITFEGNTVFSSAALLDVAVLRAGQPFNEYALQQASRALKNHYRAAGHMFASVTWTRGLSQDMGRATVVFRVVEGPVAHVGYIYFEGAATTRQSLLSERLTLEQGDSITPGELDESQARLADLGVLDSASVQMVAPDDPAAIKNLKVQIVEGKPQYLELRGGLATVDGVRGGFEYGYRNIAGVALNARLRVRGNYRLLFVGIPDFERRFRELSLAKQIEYHILLGLGQQYLPGTHGLLGWGVDLIREQVNEPAFRAVRSTGYFKLNTTLALGEYRRAFGVELRTGIENTTLTVPQAIADLGTDPEGNTDLRTNSAFLQFSRIPTGDSMFSVTGLLLTTDFRDHPFNPSSGVFASAAVDYVRSIPMPGTEDWVSNLLRTQATLSGYIPLWRNELVLALSATVGYIFHLADGSTTWPDRYFYLGGVENLRGFPEESVVPEDIYQAWKKTLTNYSDKAEQLLLSRGGEALFVLRAEVRYPLAKGFYGAAFTEVGNIWRDWMAMRPFEFNPLRVHLRPVTGVGLRYLTPIGPLAFDLGFNLDRRTAEVPLYWYLSVGTAF